MSGPDAGSTGISSTDAPRPDAGGAGSAAQPGSAAAAAPGDDYHGYPTRRLASRHLWVEVLATAGPRIIRLGLRGSSRNLLAETPDAGWQTPHGRYELFGGHRLWFAPEDPDRVAMPDGRGLTVEALADGVRLRGRQEPGTGLVRAMTLRLAPDAPRLEIRHELRNGGDAPIELAPWSITQLPLGGTVLLPQAAATPGHHVRPNRMLVLWPYTSWEDHRLRPRDGLLILDATTGPSLKVGYFDDAGWVGYVRDEALLVRRFEPRGGSTHPDLGCNVEVYIGGRFLELEVLGPLGIVGPGATATLVEQWEVVALESDAGRARDPRDLAAGIGGTKPVSAVATASAIGS